MSNATRTTKTAFVGLRLPLDLLVKIDQSEGDRTSVIVGALREKWPTQQIVTLGADGPSPPPDHVADPGKMVARPLQSVEVDPRFKIAHKLALGKDEA